MTSTPPPTSVTSSASVEPALPAWARFELPAAIFIVTFVVFAASLFGEFLSYDDEPNFVLNPDYRGLGWNQLRWMFTTTHAGHYQPLSWLTLGMDYAFWEMNPLGYHFTNVLLHAITGTLVYFVLLALLRKADRRAVWAAAAGALFFSLHPLRVESVAWITERRDVLSGALLLASVLAYLRDRRALSLSLYACSLLSKASGMSLAVALFTVDLLLLGKDWRRAALQKLPYLALGLGAAGMAAYAQVSQGATASVADHGLGERVLQAGFGLAFYAWKTVLPLNLSPLVPRPDMLRWSDPTYVLPLAVALIVTLGLFIVRKRQPLLLAAWLWYAIMVSPVLGLLQSGPQLVADRYSYLPSLAFSGLVAAAVCKWSVPVFRVGTACALALIATLTVMQCSVWNDSMSMWDQAVRVDGANPIALRGRAAALIAKGDFGSALADLDCAIQASPEYPDARTLRGFVRAQHLQDAKGALVDWSIAIAVMERTGRRVPEAYGYRGSILLQMGDARAAVPDLAKALDLAPAAWPPRATVERDLKRARELSGP